MVLSISERAKNTVWPSPKGSFVAAISASSSTYASRRAVAIRVARPTVTCWNIAINIGKRSHPEATGWISLLQFKIQKFSLKRCKHFLFSHASCCSNPFQWLFTPNCGPLLALSSCLKIVRENLLKNNISTPQRFHDNSRLSSYQDILRNREKWSL